MKIELICDVCGKRFLRCKGEVNRNARMGRRTYCSLKCVGKGNNSHLDKYKNKPFPEGFRGSRIDKYSPFRWFLARCKQRKKEVDITLQDLKEQWEVQKGICPYTGWKLKIMEDLNVNNQLPKTPDRASLDRIDSSKGYVKGNIQFVSMMAQFAKSNWPEEELIKFCEAVVENNSYQVDK